MARIEAASVRAELDQTRTALEQAVQLARKHAEEAIAAQARAETAERARDEAVRELVKAEALEVPARAEAERFQKTPELRDQQSNGWFESRVPARTFMTSHL